MQNILKTDSFVKYNKIKLNYIQKESKDDNIEIKTKHNMKRKINVINEYKEYDFLSQQDNVLNILMELRNYDNSNGTNLFTNISYNNLNAFILKNSL